MLSKPKIGGHSPNSVRNFRILHKREVGFNGPANRWTELEKTIV